MPRRLYNDDRSLRVGLAHPTLSACLRRRENGEKCANSLIAPKSFPRRRTDGGSICRRDNRTITISQRTAICCFSCDTHRIHDSSMSLARVTIGNSTGSGDERALDTTRRATLHRERALGGRLADDGAPRTRSRTPTRGTGGGRGRYLVCTLSYAFPLSRSRTVAKAKRCRRRREENGGEKRRRTKKRSQDELGGAARCTPNK